MIYQENDTPTMLRFADFVRLCRVVKILEGRLSDPADPDAGVCPDKDAELFKAWSELSKVLAHAEDDPMPSAAMGKAAWRILERKAVQAAA